jgi:integrase
MAEDSALAVRRPFLARRRTGISSAPPDSAGILRFAAARRARGIGSANFVADRRRGRARQFPYARSCTGVGAQCPILLTYTRPPPTPKSLEQTRHALTPVRAFFGGTRAARVTPDLIRAFIEQRRKAGRANATINRGLELLRKAFALAVKGKILAAYAAPEIPKLPEQNARQGFFEKTELEALLPHLPSPLEDLARVAYRTGWRRGELLGLRWEWVDLAEDLGASSIRLPDSKNGKPRSVPLDSELAALMARLRIAREFATSAGAGLSAYVFHRNGKPINKAVFGKQWRRACVEAGLGVYQRVTKNGGARREYRGKVFHDFRRTAARNFIRSGVSQEVAKKITGHRTDSMFSRYNITDERDKLNALEAARAYVESLPAAKSNVVGFRRS